MTVDPHHASDVREYRGQTYVRVGEEPYTRRDGAKTTLIVWRSRCANCGVEFECRTSAVRETFHPPRTCPAHRRKLGWRETVQVTDPSTVPPATWPQRPFPPVETYAGVKR